MKMELEPEGSSTHFSAILHSHIPKGAWSGQSRLADSSFRREGQHSHIKSSKEEGKPPGLGAQATEVAC